MIWVELEGMTINVNSIAYLTPNGVGSTYVCLVSGEKKFVSMSLEEVKYRILEVTWRSISESVDLALAAGCKEVKSEDEVS